MPNKFGIASGPVGDTVFHTPFFAPFDRQNELPQLFQHVENLHDHRLLAIVSALILEERLDKLLSAFLPRYTTLSDCSEFTFSMKIRTLEALNFIPKGITEACHIVRLIRNEFAHNLDRIKITDIDKGTIRKIDEMLRRAGMYCAEPGEEGAFKNFKHASFIAICGTNSYITSFSRLRSKIEDVKYIETIPQELDKEFEAKCNELRAKGPKLVRRNGTMWEYVYDCFSEISDKVPPAGVPLGEPIGVETKEIG